MVAPSHPGANWSSAEWQRHRAEVAQAERARLARYYAEAGRREEERQNADERERFARSQRRG
jgi:hypothetical protein